jgi:hypothetical protein
MPAFIAALSRSSRLTDQEIQQLKEIVDAHQ